MNPLKPAASSSATIAGLAAYGGRVYGMWTEKPVPAPEAKDKPERQDKDSKEAKPLPRGTIVKIGTADFTPNRAK